MPIRHVLGYVHIRQDGDELLVFVNTAVFLPKVQIKKALYLITIIMIILLPMTYTMEKNTENLFSIVGSMIVFPFFGQSNNYWNGERGKIIMVNFVISLL